MASIWPPAAKTAPLKLWDLAGQCLLTFQGHRSAVSSLAFYTPAPDAAPLLISGSHDETLRLWDLTTGNCLQVLRPPRLYEGMTLAQAQGLNDWAIAALEELGAKI